MSTLERGGGDNANTTTGGNANVTTGGGSAASSTYVAPAASANGDNRTLGRNETLGGRGGRRGGPRRQNRQDR